MDPVGPDPFVLAEPASERAWPALRAAGFEVREVPASTDEVGHAQLLVARPDGGLEAAADPRSDGGAAAR